LAEELIDPRESGYVFAHPEDFYHDLGMVMQRGRDLAGVPLVADSERFPPRTMMIELLAFNRIVREHLEARRSFDPNRAEHYRKLIAECDRLYKVWDIARDASTDYYYVTVRRRALKRLREMLGDADYYGARLPDHIP
jgi:hypothetical protein